MRRLLATWLFALIAFFAAVPAHADGVDGVIIVATCGSPPYALNPWSQITPTLGIITVDTTGKLCANVTASLGGFTPSASGARMTPLSVATSDSSGNLPTGAVVVVSNVGTSNPMYCNVNGVAATTSDQLIGANSWFAFTIPAAITTLRCIATGGSTTANGVGGAGLPTGAGGGSSGGSSNAVFGPTAVASANANPPVVIGGTVTGAAGQNVEGVAVKPASTAPVATDLALVVTESPNSPLITGASTVLAGTAPSTQTAATSGNVTKLQSDLNGNLYISPQQAGGAPVDPCQANTKTWTPINISASGTDSTPIVAGVSGKKTYVCQIILNNNAADNVAVVEATTSTSCATVTKGLWGGTTAATGFNFSANGGVSIGQGGFYIANTTTANDDVCIITSAATQLTGGILTVQQ